MALIHGCHVTSREAMLFIKYEHYGKCKGSFKESQKKCKYICMKIHEDSLKTFQVVERTRLRCNFGYGRSSMGNNSRSINARVMVLALCISSNAG